MRWQRWRSERGSQGSRGSELPGACDTREGKARRRCGRRHAWRREHGNLDERKSSPRRGQRKLAPSVIIPSRAWRLASQVRTSRRWTDDLRSSKRESTQLGWHSCGDAERNAGAHGRCKLQRRPRPNRRRNPEPSLRWRYLLLRIAAPELRCEVVCCSWWSRVMASPQSKTHRLLLVALLCISGALLVWHHVLMEPSCEARGEAPAGLPPSLRVVVVADLHLAGPRTAWVDRVRRESFMRSVFQRAHRRLNPDALVVLGDVSDAGRKSSDAQWSAVVARFWDLVRPFSAVPIQVVVGNHDVGDHHDPGFSSRLPRFAASFPGLDDTCCSRFTWNGVDFVSLNAMAIHRDGCSACSRVEKNVGNISSSLEARRKDINDPNIGGADGASSGPVLLLHLPLYRADDNVCDPIDLPRCAPWHDLEGSCLKVGSAPPLVMPQELLHRVGQDVLSDESSIEILESLRPRLVLSGHTHRWCHRVHADGTREVTVPSLSWRNRDDPSFALLTFHANSVFTIQHCKLAHESTVVLLYILWACTILSWLFTASCILVSRFRSKSVKPE